MRNVRASPRKKQQRLCLKTSKIEAKYNVDESQSVAQQLGVRGIPTLAVYKDGSTPRPASRHDEFCSIRRFLKTIRIEILPAA